MIHRNTIALAVLLLSVFSVCAHAQNAPVVIKASDGTSIFNVWDAANGGIKFSCVFGCGGAGGGSSAAIVDGSTFTAGTTNAELFAGIFDDALAAVSSGHAAGARITSKRAIHVNFRAADGTEIGTAAAPIRTDPTGTTTQPVSVASLPAHDVTNAGTFAVQVTSAPTTAITASSLPLPTGAATDRPTAGSPGAVRLSDGAAFYKPTTPADTQPISAASLPLPSGASTAAKQPALGSAGAASADVLTVQGIASMTALKVDGSAVTQPVSGTVTATGPLTDTQLRASNVGVSVNNFPTTASSSSVSVRCVNAAGSAFESCAGGSGGTTGQQTMANSAPVVIASDQSSVPILQSQPARTTGTLTSTTCPGTGCVSVATTGYGSATVTVSGTYSVTAVFEFSTDGGTTYFPTTCTRTDAAVQETTTGAIVSVSRAWDCSVYATTNFRVRASTFVSGSAAVGFTLTSAAVEAAPTVSMIPPTLTLGTRPSTGITVQQIVDTSRANVSLTFSSTAPTTADTVVTALVKNINAATLGGAQSIVPSAGNTLRLQSAIVQIRATAATTPWVLVTLRESGTATCTASSSVVAYLAAAGTAAVIGNTGTLAVSWPNGWQISEASTHSFCISVAGNVNTNVLNVSIQAIEFGS
jgi:hypothetical protein